MSDPLWWLFFDDCGDDGDGDGDGDDDGDDDCDDEVDCDALLMMNRGQGATQTPLGWSLCHHDE